MPKPTQPPSPMTTHQHVAENVTKLALQINEPVVHYLVTGRSLCRDLDTLLILLVIIQRANRHPDFALLDARELAEGQIDEIPSLAANLHSVADSTGIPRETVRRKVQALFNAGWVVRDGPNVRLTVEGYRTIAPLREAAVRMAATITDSVSRSLAARDA